MLVRRTRLVAGLLMGFVTAAVMLASSGTALAEGSKDLFPATAAACQANSLGGSCRASLEWRSETYGPAGSAILRRTLFSVFAKQGEVILTGSSAVGIASGATSGDVLIYNPDPDPHVLKNTQDPNFLADYTPGFRCSDQRAATGLPTPQGMITSRAQELAGPLPSTGGYLPCSYVAPLTGIYNVVIYGPKGGNASGDGGPTGEINDVAGNFDASQGTSVSAWDITVRQTLTSADLPGRVFTYALAAFTAGNARPVNSSFYVTTTDGFVYKTDLRGLDPNGFLLYGNQKGFLDADGVTPLDHDVLGVAPSGGNLSALAGSVTFAPPTFPLSFAPLAPDTLVALGITDHPQAPVMTGLSFTGSVAGNFSLVGAGGTFSYTENVPAQYEFVISRDGVNFDPGNPLNRVLRGEQPAAGTYSVSWDGKDNSGANFPVGTNYPVRARLHNGEYHFPMIDAENSTKGGPTFTLQNAPGGTCPFGNSSCTTAFYDDRGYHTDGPSGADVGVPGGLLCINNAPTVDHSDPVNGYDSASTTQRAYGRDANAGSNTNIPCDRDPNPPHPANNGSFGDVKGLDTWVFYPSTTILAPLNIISVAAAGTAPAASPDHGTTPVNTPLVVTPTNTVLGNDTGTSITVTAHTAPSHGTVSIGADGSYTYTPTTGYTGPDSYTYTITDNLGRTATTTVSLTVTPVAKPDSATTPEGVPVTLASVDNDLGRGLTITAVAQPPAGTGSTKIVNGQIVYTPPPGYVGVTTYTYTVTDAAGQTATALDTVTVVPGPKAKDDKGSGHAGQTVVLHPLTNDTPSDTSTFDVTTLKLTDPKTHKPVTTVTLAGKGTFTLTKGGVVTFVPVYGYTGTTPAIGYTVSDTLGGKTNATIVVTIGPGPTAIPDHKHGHAGETVTLAPQSNDTPSPGTPSAGGAKLVPSSLRLIDPVTGKAVTTVTVAGEGTYTMHGNGTVTFVPVAGFTGTTKHLAYTELDSFKQKADSYLTIDIDPGPTAVDDHATTPKNTPVTIDPLGNDTPSKGATFVPGTLRLTDPVTGSSVTSVSVPGQGIYTTLNGKVVFTPDPDFTGTTTPLSYTIGDTFGQSTGAKITVEVSGSGLPFTGFELASALGSGFGLVAIGVVFLLLVRRRPVRR